MHALNHSVPSAAASSIIIDNIRLISLRLVFGGYVCPSLWCPMAEIVTDLANDILGCNDLGVKSLHIPHNHKFLTQSFYPPKPHLSPIYPPMFTPHPNQEGKLKGYIDNFTPTVLYHDDNVKRVVYVVPSPCTL